MAKDNFQKLNNLIKLFYKELCSPDFSFLMRKCRTKVNPCRVIFNRKINILGKINIIFPAPSTEFLNDFGI